MKTIAALLLALLAPALVPSSTRPVPHDLTDSVRAEVESAGAGFLARYVEVIEGDDPEAIRDLFVDDDRLAWFSDGEKRYTSADDVLASLASMEDMEFSTEGSEVEVVALTPDLAHARSAFATKILRGEAVVFEYSGVITWLLERGEDGAWRVLSGHTSTPKPR